MEGTAWETVQRFDLITTHTCNATTTKKYIYIFTSQEIFHGLKFKRGRSLEIPLLLAFHEERIDQVCGRTRDT